MLSFFRSYNSAARDNDLDKVVAIKKIVRAFSDTSDSKRTLREIRLMRHLQVRTISSSSSLFALN